MWRSSVSRSKSAGLDGDDGNLTVEPVGTPLKPKPSSVVVTLVLFHLSSTGCLETTRQSLDYLNPRGVFSRRSRRPIRRRQHRQTLVDSKRVQQTKTNNLRANGVKPQGAEPGAISLRERGKKGNAAVQFLLLVSRTAARPDKSYIIDMILRLSGRAYVITSDTLNPSQIRFPNQPTSRLTAAFRAWNESAPPPQTEHT